MKKTPLVYINESVENKTTATIKKQHICLYMMINMPMSVTRMNTKHYLILEVRTIWTGDRSWKDKSQYTFYPCIFKPCGNVLCVLKT